MRFSRAGARGKTKRTRSSTTADRGGSSSRADRRNLPGAIARRPMKRAPAQRVRRDTAPAPRHTVARTFPRRSGDDRPRSMSPSVVAFSATVARVAPARASRSAPRRARVRVVARASRRDAASDAVGFASARRACGVALGAAALTASAAPPAHAMEGVFANPAVLGATCVAVCWGIPQTLGMMVLDKKEAAGRAKCAEWGIDVSDVEEGNWGRIRQLIKKEAERRGEEMPKF